MVSSTGGSTPAKKATPAADKNKDTSPSLSDLLGKKNDSETNTPEENAAPESDKNVNEAQKTTFRPDEIDRPVDNTDKSGSASTQTDDNEKADKPALSRQTVSTVPNKTPAELAAETADQTAERYGIDQSVSDEDADNPRVQVYRDTHVNQVPSGTHLHPDIAKDMLNRGISEQHTDNAQVKRTITEAYDFAPDAEFNDKF